jgi:hypothetical protein
MSVFLALRRRADRTHDERVSRVEREGEANGAPRFSRARRPLKEDGQPTNEPTIIRATAK